MGHSVGILLDMDIYDSVLGYPASRNSHVTHTDAQALKKRATESYNRELQQRTTTNDDEEGDEQDERCKR